jgi:hypothetical protein
MQRADFVPASNREKRAGRKRAVDETYRPWSQTLVGMLYGIFRFEVWEVVWVWWLVELNWRF